MIFGENSRAAHFTAYRARWSIDAHAGRPVVPQGYLDSGGNWAGGRVTSQDLVMQTWAVIPEVAARAQLVRRWIACTNCSPRARI